jgi:hypothetical protein
VTRVSLLLPLFASIFENFELLWSKDVFLYVAKNTGTKKIIAGRQNFINKKREKVALWNIKKIANAPPPPIHEKLVYFGKKI